MTLLREILGRLADPELIVRREATESIERVEDIELDFVTGGGTSKSIIELPSAALTAALGLSGDIGPGCVVGTEGNLIGEVEGPPTVKPNDLLAAEFSFTVGLAWRRAREAAVGAVKVDGRFALLSPNPKLVAVPSVFGDLAVSEGPDSALLLPMSGVVVLLSLGVTNDAGIGGRVPGTVPADGFRS